MCPTYLNKRFLTKRGGLKAAPFFVDYLCTRKKTDEEKYILGYRNPAGLVKVFSG